ncbi:MAG: molybdopterin-dependent oxidoreductase, partial [Candidatus Binataceae bacterium]
MATEFSRRSFLKMAAVTGAALAADGCRNEQTRLIPYLVPDNNVIPGVPAFYRTLCNECGAGCGVVARVREGRVTKLEGNPSNPINAGALCARGQASLQGLYNPDRLTGPHRRESNGKLAPVSWPDAFKILGEQCKKSAAAGADRIAIIARPHGPAIHSISSEFIKAFNSKRLSYFEPLSETAALKAAKSCFGSTELPSYRIDRAQVLISFGAPFLETWHSPLELSRQYADFRTPKKPAGDQTIGLAYYVGPRMNLSAAKTDRFVMCPPGAESAVALAVLYWIAEQGRASHAADLDALKAYVADFSPDAVAKRTGVDAKVIKQMATAFGRGPSAVALAGTEDPVTHAAAFIMNAVTGNAGKTQILPQPEAGTNREPRPGGRKTIAPLLAAMRSGAIDMLIIADSNPAFALPSHLEFGEAVKRVPLVIWAGSVPDESADFAHLLLTIDHPLEEWSDSAPRPGVHVLG